MPLSWLYIRTSVTGKPLSKWDLFHLLPVALYLVEYFPFLISSTAVKTAALQADITNLNQLLRYSQGWLLPANSQIPIRAVQTMVYWGLQIGLLSSSATAPMRKDRSWVRWMILYNALQIPLFLNPRILYGLKEVDSPPPSRAKPLLLDNEFVQYLTIALEKVMREEKPFLHADYTLKKLADAVGVPLYKLSAYINQVTGTNFSEYLNQWRIRYCLDLIEEKKIIHLNLHGIATTCGFNNRNTFSSAFKKVTGKPPSVYLHAKS
jgi:AraC-like DNA-binding protein